MLFGPVSVFMHAMKEVNVGGKKSRKGIQTGIVEGQNINEMVYEEI